MLRLLLWWCYSVWCSGVEAAAVVVVVLLPASGAGRVGATHSSEGPSNSGNGVYA